MKPKFASQIIFKITLLFISMSLARCSSDTVPEWQQKNDELISKHNLKKREISGLKTSGIGSNPAAGKVIRLDKTDSIMLHPGVNARIFWGSGAMTNILHLDPNAKIPEETLPGDRFVFVLGGSVDQLIGGTWVNMISRKREEPDGAHSTTPRTDFVYMEKGTKNAVTAGASGAILLEVYSPLRVDYLQKAAVKNLPKEIVEPESKQVPKLVPNKVYDLYDIQFTELPSGSLSRIVTGRNIQLSFISTDPGSAVPYHIHPEEQTSLVLRGSLTEMIPGGEQIMNSNTIVQIPGNMVHGSKSGDIGCDALEIFWPARTDYIERQQLKLNAFHAIIPEDAKLELVIDGRKTKPALIFTEGPKWLKGKLYFSNMYFDQAWNADPKKSSTIEMDTDGMYRNITEGKMQTNGLYPYKNGNLLACDMMGHRVVEMTTKGEVIKIIADKYEGKPIDGPNDVITDAKGGVYFTDPQFTMEPKKFQPGRAVYYVSPGGKIKRIVEPNEFAMPNGIVLSPDGKTLFINNCYDDETWYPVNSEKENFIWAYDVNPDGTISNGRKFAKLLLTENVLNRKAKSSSADGMAIDKTGNLYVCTYYGVQIFNARGEFIGMINLPSFPVSLCFGDDDMKTLYIVSYSKVFKIRTNREGFVQYL